MPSLIQWPMLFLWYIGIGYIYQRMAPFYVLYYTRGNGATVAREIPDLKVGGSNPSFLKNFVFLFFFNCTLMASLLELRNSGREIPDLKVGGSNPSFLKNFVFLFFFNCTLMASLLELRNSGREIPDLKVGGSNPSFLKNICFVSHKLMASLVKLRNSSFATAARFFSWCYYH